MSDRVIASLGAGPQQRLLALARRTIEPYAARHGYELALHDAVTDGSRPAPWSKIKILLDLVHRYELVLWLDADLVVVDGRTDIASELEPGRFLYLVEHVTKAGRMPNTGVMLLRGGAQSAGFLDAVWACETYAEHRWWENAAVCELLGYRLDPPAPVARTPLIEQTKFISPRWNWIADARVPGARIRHFPGYALRTRTALMTGATLEAGLRSRVNRQRRHGYGDRSLG